jgi:hypothetical protein
MILDQKLIALFIKEMENLLEVETGYFLQMLQIKILKQST